MKFNMIYRGFEITTDRTVFRWKFGSALHIANIKKQIDAHLNK